MYTLKNPEYRAARERARALVKTMTLEEKVIQLTQYMVTENTYNPDHVEEDGEMVAGRCGTLIAAAGAELLNKYQKIALDICIRGIFALELLYIIVLIFGFKGRRIVLCSGPMGPGGEFL